MEHEPGPSLLWFRLDLRLADNPALGAAIEAGGPVVPVFIWAPEEEAPWEPGAASRWWLHHSLERLSAALRERGSRLILRRGPTEKALRALIQETGARAVFWNRRYEPAIRARDARLKEALREGGVRAESLNSALLREPWTIANQGGRPFQVFTPFWRACLAGWEPEEPRPAPNAIPGLAKGPSSESLAAFELLPKIPWDAGLRSAWEPGEAGAASQLRQFSRAAILNYGEDRDRPDRLGTSRLSPHLHFGEIGPRQVWRAARRAAEASGLPAEQWRRWQFLSELGWREFAYHLLYHFPDTPEKPLRADFERFPWRPKPALLRAWERGQTGIPLVDAGMRELWSTGWMHNRVRMVVGSFLVKNLLQPWPAGARWFWDTLVDADLASNTLGWQWVAGCGADAAPYFRVFNPVTQGRKFDPEADYVTRWVPELKGLPIDLRHAPWETPGGSPSNVRPQRFGPEAAYPEPVVSLASSRMAALAAFDELKRRRGE